MRDMINTALKLAIKNKEDMRVSTLLLMNAAIKDRDSSLRSQGDHDGICHDYILDILAKMIEQRTNNARIFKNKGQSDLEVQELDEIKIIKEFLPKQLSKDETLAAVTQIVNDLDAHNFRDIGKVMGTLKEKFAGQMDFIQVGRIVKTLLSS